MKCKVANLIFSIHGKGAYYEAFSDYFKDVETNDDGKCMLEIYILDSFDRPKASYEYYSLSKKISFEKNEYMISESGMTYSVRNLFNMQMPTVLKLVVPKETAGLKKLARRAYNRMFSAHIGDHGKYNSFVFSVANYRCLWYVFAVSLMKQKCVFVHSGMIARANKGYCLSGTSGCGKTSTMMHLISDDDFSYIAEDFGIVSSEGKMYLMQKKGAIYQSDAQYGNKLIRRALDNLPKKEKREWKRKVKRGINAVYYFKPLQLFDGSRIANDVLIVKTYFLVRSYQEQLIREHEISLNEVVDRISTASFREIKELFELLTNIRAVGGEMYYPYYPSITDLMEQYKDILKKALQNSYIAVLFVPDNIDPKETARIIVS